MNESENGFEECIKPSMVKNLPIRKLYSELNLLQNPTRLLAFRLHVFFELGDEPV